MHNIFRVVALSMLIVSAASAEVKPLSGAVIVVDPGHGGQSYSKSYTGGTRGVNSKITESELNLRVGLELAKILADEGATVHLTRVADHRLSREGSSNTAELHARIDFFEHHGCHFFLSVHHNAGPETATGHTAITKHNAKDDTLYESLAREVNDALAAAVPGPKRKLLKGSYHLTRETTIPGTISEAGFLTNAAYDKLANEPAYAKREATALAAGAVMYWRAHKPALVKMQAAFVAEKVKKPADMNAYTATQLNPDYQKAMAATLAKIAPAGKYDASKVKDYLRAFQQSLPPGGFDIQAAFDGKTIKLTGKAAERKYHDQWIDLLVAMKLYAIANGIELPQKVAAEKP